MLHSICHYYYLIEFTWHFFWLAYLERPTVLDKSPGLGLGQYCNIFISLSFLGSLLKRRIRFENFSQFSLPPPSTKLKLEEKFCIHASNVVCEERLDLCELENAPEMQNCPKTFVHDCSCNRNQTIHPDVWCIILLVDKNSDVSSLVYWGIKTFSKGSPC